MFENIIGNASLIRTLTLELGNATLPNALLLAGPAYTGKLSTALEIARVLTCKNRGDWSCACASCEQHRLLIHPYTVLAGQRGFQSEIRAARDVLVRTNSVAAHYLFVRAVRKLTRRFDPNVFQAEESRLREIQDLLLRTEDSLTALSPGGAPEEGKKHEKLLETTENLAEKLSGFLPKDNIPVAVIRNISQWAYITAPSNKKIVILENATRMLDASRNALLKIIEEPPRDVVFILIAERAAELIPTIRSRLRLYRFLPRSREESREVLHRIFKEDNPEYATLREYFLAWDDIQEKALAPDPVVIQNEIPELFQRDAPRDLVKYFMEELVALFQSLLARGAEEGKALPPLHQLESWVRLIRTRTREFQTLNLSPALFIESLFLAMREKL
jgi:DNA polymerase-3 subunit gamma/tau